MSEPPSESNVDGAPATPAAPTASARTEAPQGPQLVIWGTDVVVSECKDRFKAFILQFVNADTEEDERVDGMNTNEPLYLQKLEEVRFVALLRVLNNVVDVYRIYIYMCVYVCMYTFKGVILILLFI